MILELRKKRPSEKWFIKVFVKPETSASCKMWRDNTEKSAATLDDDDVQVVHPGGRKHEKVCYFCEHASSVNCSSCLLKL